MHGPIIPVASSRGVAEMAGSTCTVSTESSLLSSSVQVVFSILRSTQHTEFFTRQI